MPTDLSDEPDQVARVRDIIRQHCIRSFLYLHFEPTNACNTVCDMCPRDAMVRPVQLMAWDLFRRLLDVTLCDRLPMVSIVGFGEPTLHPRLSDMVGEIRRRQRNVIIKLTTNGAVKSYRQIDQLYDAGLDLLELSVVGHDRETYERSMRLDFLKTVRIVEELCARGRKFAIVTIGLTPGQAEATRSFWAERGVLDVRVKALHRRGGYLETKRVGVADSGDYVRRDHMSRVTRSEGRSEECHKLFMFLHVNAVGQFIPCVQEINSKNILFTVDDVRSFDDVLARMADVEPRFDICAGCELKCQDHLDYYARFLLQYFSDRIPALLRTGSNA